ncbi:MAG: hypothetical protein J6I80_04305 [Clostridia bacterium]|nr:hypothetical protein [Clostridia bacterium]
MLKNKKNLSQITLAIAYTALCVLCVSTTILYTPPKRQADAKQSKVEYTPKPQSDERIMLCCSHCGSRSILALDFEQGSSSLLRLNNAEEQNYTAKITLDEELVCALADGAGGVNFTLWEDTPYMSAGSWRLTGSQVWQLLYLENDVLYEQLMSELFYTVFRFGLQNNQIYIILEYGIYDGLSYSRLYNIAYYSKDWLSELVVVS